MARLTLDDIADLRAYEREREAFRAHVIALKRRRRVAVGPVVTLVFENRDTIRFQIQEMARAERIMTDEGIQAELDVYGSLVPEPGHLAATLFLELTDEEQMRTWLPRLVGIEAAVELHLGEGDGAEAVRCRVDPDHERQLTREEATAAVHYVHLALDPDQVRRVEEGPVAVAIAHPAYAHRTTLGDDTRAELLADLRGG